MAAAGFFCSGLRRAKPMYQHPTLKRIKAKRATSNAVTTSGCVLTTLWALGVNRGKRNSYAILKADC